MTLKSGIYLVSQNSDVIVPDKYQNKYRIPSARLQTWDYSSNGAYFITICTAKRHHYFGEIIHGEMQLSEIGKMANQCWLEIPEHFQFVSLDAFVVMPNHLHGIIVIDKPDNDRRVVDDGSVVEMGHVETEHAPSLHAPSLRERPRNLKKNSISAMVGSFKSAVTKWCNDNSLSFGWQTRFHDHIIRDKDEFHRIRNYIINNPGNWNKDKFFS